jgi:hypothetical protein
VDARGAREWARRRVERTQEMVDCRVKFVSEKGREQYQVPEDDRDQSVAPDKCGEHYCKRRAKRSCRPEHS